MRELSHLLAVDGGNTKTVAIVADVSGRIVGVAKGSCSDIYATPTPDDAITEIVATASAALDAARVAPQNLIAAGYSLAGADWPEDFELLERSLAQRIPTQAPPLVVNDAIGALWTGAGEGIGAAAACGTHAAFAAAGPKGSWHASFWAEPGGAVHLATAALRAVRRADLGSAPGTLLSQRILSDHGFASVEALLHHFTGRDRPPRAAIGRLARTVLDVADRGDAVACALVDDLATGVADSVRAAASKVALEAPYPVVLTGGLLKHPSHVFADAVRSRFAPDTVELPRVPPVVGALRMAAKSAGIALEREAAELGMPDEAGIAEWRDAA